jgi:hypothetical protein
MTLQHSSDVADQVMRQRRGGIALQNPRVQAAINTGTLVLHLILARMFLAISDRPSGSIAWTDNQSPKTPTGSAQSAVHRFLEPHSKRGGHIQS